MKGLANLKKCPFCGAEAKIISGYGKVNYVRCTECEVETGGYWSDGEAVDAWNRRYAEQQRERSSCKNCKHMPFSDCYGECDIRLRIVNPNMVCEKWEEDQNG